jgi:hypothetical protein
VRVNLVAVQAKMSLADYSDSKAFQRKVADLMDGAMRQIDGALPTLVAFPECLGMYLSFVPRYWDSLKSETRMDRAVDLIVSRFASHLEPRLRKDPRSAAQRLLFLEGATDTEAVYFETFSTLARQHSAYVVAGSLCVPRLEESPHRGGRFVADDSKAYSKPLAAVLPALMLIPS